MAGSSQRVDGAATEARMAAEQTRTAADSLNRTANQIQQLITRFQLAPDPSNSSVGSASLPTARLDRS
jgi:hypothetical protein